MVPHRPEDARRSTATVPRWTGPWLSVNLLAKSIRSLAPSLGAGTILDIGCGNQPYRAWIAPGARYVGLDVSPANRSAAVIGSSMALPFADAAFEAAICTQTLEHVEHPAALLAEANRVLKPGGRLLLSAPMYWPAHEEPFDFYRYTEHGLRYLFDYVGLQIESIQPQGGAWRVVGQAFANTLVESIPFRTFGIKGLVLLVSNSFFDWLDNVNYHRKDTCNWVVLAVKTQTGI